MARKRKNKKGFCIAFLLILILLGICAFLFYNYGMEKEIKTFDSYIKSSSNEVTVYDLEYNESINIIRGTNVKAYEVKEVKDENTFVKIEYNGEYYMIDENYLTDDKNSVISENEMFVRTNVTLYKEANSLKILSSIKKGERLEILGYDKINSDGSVNKYKVKYNDLEGFVYAKYLVATKELADRVYDENGLQEYMSKMGDTLGGGTATKLDFYPYEKPKFEDNVMPDEARTIYINSSAVKDMDQYIDFALNNNINAFVIDIKDNTSPAYNSNVMKEYSPTNYNHALNEYEDYKAYVKKAKDAGIYVIGRITTFKDSYYINDHPDDAIKNKSGSPFSHNGSYWPTAYNRNVWEFSVALAKEAVLEIGFNEIQFDYVRFPDRTTTLERNGTINLNNVYNESKAEALQGFIMYACDELHNVGAYVSIDVFGESASDYVTAYGQFWPAISNIADAISGMPYPDHFNAHEYGISEVVWTVPYKLLNAWGKSVAKKQSITPTPAVVRTWIQTYNTTKEPSVIYDANKISDQIQALYDNGLTGGFMTWNSGSNLKKYKEVSYAFRKVYK